MSVFSQVIMRAKNEVPSMYQQVDFIQNGTNSSTALQYIDTGISAPDGFTAELECIIPSQRSQLCILWGEDDGNTTGIWNSQGLRSMTRTGYLQLGQSSVKTSIQYTVNTDLIINFSTIKNNGYVSVNGHMVRASGSAEGLTYSDNTLYLFACHSGNNVKDFIIGLVLGYVKIWNVSNKLVRNFVPVLNKNTNKYGLYDKVSRAFFGNLGQGDFRGIVNE